MYNNKYNNDNKYKAHKLSVGKASLKLKIQQSKRNNSKIKNKKNNLSINNDYMNNSKIKSMHYNNSVLNNNGINSSNSNNNTDTSNKNKKKNSNINVNVNVNTGNKFAILNTIHKNNLIKYTKLTQQIEAINKLKQHLYSGIYFIYVEKINEGFLFKGIYKRGASEINPICNKIYGVQNTPLMLSYEKFLILTENNKKEFIPLKLSSINLINYSNSILLVRND